ncbi:MAG TPA: STAS domain-containing protein [Dehalococcoidia bacterium]|nr:STAS domain-containing protein [Dehalococcoidia bacterium]
MPTDWSDDIVVSNLTDEPALSDELQAIVERVQFTRGRTPSIVLDFAQVTYLNSSNLAQLLRLRQLLQERDADMRLCSLCDEIRSIFMVTGLERVFRFAPDALTALAGLQLERQSGKGQRP